MSTTEDEAPTSFKCPITLQIMRDPVIDHDGNSYERVAITDWIRDHGTSPITRRPLQLSDLTTNRALKDLIDAYLGGGSLPAQAQSITIQNTAPLEEYQDSITVKALKYSADELYIEIKPSESAVPTRCDIVACIDISGSMGELATIPGGEATSLSILDIVKHACKAIVKSLSPHDRFSIVSFSDNADIVLGLVNMDEEGQKKAFEKLDALHPTNSTNIWAGLDKSMEVLNDRTSNSRTLSAVLLLTDGVPNINPPRGIIPTLNLRKERGGLPDIIQTFGFGYNLDSKLLVDIAEVGCSSFAFIPDPGFVGTIFVHSVANLLSTCAISCKVSIPTASAAPFECIFQSTRIDGGLSIDLGKIQIGQTKSFTVKGDFSDNATAKIEILLRNGEYVRVASAIESRNEGGDLAVLDCKSRMYFVQEVSKLFDLAIQNSAESSPHARQDAASQLSTSIRSLYTNQVSEFTSNLLIDLSGQVVEAFKDDYFRKWGRHYLPSLLFAHKHQICNNFKDPGIQKYGGRLFEKIRDLADELFCKLPAPVPSSSTNTYYGSSQVSASAPVNMASFNNAGGVCFHADTLVRLYDGSFTKASLLQRGDKLWTCSSEYASVECVVESILKHPVRLLQLDDCGCMVTPYHPILVHNRWRFPVNVSDSVLAPSQSTKVYNFVLDKPSEIIQVGSFQTLTLGHGFVNDPVAYHPFFGTCKVLQELQAVDGYAEGRVQIRGVVRDPITGLVESFAPSVSNSANENQLKPETIFALQN